MSNNLGAKFLKEKAKALKSYKKRFKNIIRRLDTILDNVELLSVCRSSDDSKVVVKSEELAISANQILAELKKSTEDVMNEILSDIQKAQEKLK